MTEFIKKVLVLDEIATGFGFNGKKASGVLKVQKNGNRVAAGIYVANFCKSKADFLECVLLVGKKVYNAKSDVCSFVVAIDDVKQCDDVACLLCAVRQNNGVPFAFGSSNKSICADHLAKHLECAQVTQYEQFVCATENYFEDSLDLNKLKEKSVYKFKPIELLSTCKQTGEKTFFANAKDMLVKIFETYPPCDELNDSMQDSFWVKVPFKDSKFFSLGLLQKEGKPYYIAYGVPGRVDRPPNEDGFSFFATKNNQVGFWIICQDAKTGFAASQPYFWV